MVLALGADAVAPDRGSVLFSGNLRTVYDVNLRLRTAMRVLVPLVRGEVKSRKSLYELAASVAWARIFLPCGMKNVSPRYATRKETRWQK